MRLAASVSNAYTLFMNRSPYLLLASALLMLLGSLTGGCGSDPKRDTDWTVDEGKLALDRTLRVSETDSFYFGNISDIAVDGDGRAYVLDGDAQHVKVIGREGGLQDSLGSKGQGPGEFQRAREVAVARGDSLYVLDSRSSRISVFTPARRFAYDVQVEFKGFTETLMVPGNHAGFVLANTSFSLSETSEGGSFSVYRVSPVGSITDTLLAAPSLQTETIQQGGRRLVLSIPFGQQPHVALGPQDRIHFGQNDSLRVTSHSFDGPPAPPTRLPFERISISDQERTNRLEKFPDEHRSKIRNAIPATKPAFDHLLVDDESRYWFGRPTANADSTAWWVAMPSEKRVVTETLPSEVEILAVKNGQAYGRAKTEAGAPALVRYQVQTSK